MKKLLLVVYAIPFFILFNHEHLYVNARTNNYKNTNKTRQFQKRQLNSDEIECVDLADFFYEIVLGVTSFPEQGDCSEQEEAEIAVLLQKGINKEMRAIPGTIKTQNKVCSDPINNRRMLWSHRNKSPFMLLPSDYQNQNVDTPIQEDDDNDYDDDGDGMPSQHDERILLRHGRRSFIYVGGGRCRFCFYDDYDQRALVAVPVSSNNRHASKALVSSNKHNKYAKYYRHTVRRARRKGRNLLFIPILLKPHRQYPTVADVSLCQLLHPIGINMDLRHKSIKWINKKKTAINLRRNGSEERTIVFGPYLPGDNFGVQYQYDIHRPVDVLLNQTQHKFVDRPVKEAGIRFSLHSLDLPTDLASGVLLDDPLILFVNGLKLDFRLLMAQPGVRTKQTSHYQQVRGTSFAGIKWEIRKITSSYYEYDFAGGPEPDCFYDFRISAPYIIFDHKNQVDIDFVIKPNAKAKKYVLGRVAAVFKAVECQVTGSIKNSPFQDFQSVVESRLFHKLGKDLALEFQGKQGHCFHDKIPVVNVHLVEKKSWKESNPQQQCAANHHRV